MSSYDSAYAFLASVGCGDDGGHVRPLRAYRPSEFAPMGRTPRFPKRPIRAPRECATCNAPLRRCATCEEGSKA